MSELIKSSITMNIELHSFMLILVVLLFFNMRNSSKRNGQKIHHSLVIIYFGSALMIITDCLWTCVSNLTNPGDKASYIINILYFISSSTASACWLIFSAKQLDSVIYRSKVLFAVSMLPFAILTMLYIFSPWFGLIFSINNGEYVRGSVFYFDPVIKMGYICGASVVALICVKKRKLEYLRKKDLALALFSVPVVLGGILQTVLGVDFNCLGVTLGMILIYITGITNSDSENVDAIFSLANSFEASYIVNMNTGLIRSLHKDRMHDKDVPGMSSMDYTVHFNSVLSGILLPEDRDETLAAFDIANVASRFKIDNSFSIRYRVREKSGLTALHTASFIRAAGREGRQEFLLGINSIKTDSLLYERNEALKTQNLKLEQINTSIIESVAKIVEARDGGSGDHIVRVRKLTEILAREIMTEYPEFNLDEERVKLISSASVLHDVGKIVIPDAVLLKPGRLTPEEFEIMKGHSTKGCDILNIFPLGLDDAFLECALSICRWHHEKYDGKGYPDGLKGDEIPIAAQIVSVADCMDALVSDRPYKKALPPDKAFDMILNGECGEFSPKMYEILKKRRSKLIELSRLYR